MKQKLSSSLGYNTIKDKYGLGLKRIGKLDNSEPFLVVFTMSIDRYYSSIIDEQSPMTENTEALLEKQDFMGLFKTFFYFFSLFEKIEPW